MGSCYQNKYYPGLGIYLLLLLIVILYSVSLIVHKCFVMETDGRSCIILYASVAS